MNITLATPIVSNTSSAVTSGSFTPTVGVYLVAIAHGSGTSGSVNANPTVTDSRGGSWSQKKLANHSNPGGAGQGAGVSISTRYVSVSQSMTVTNTVSGGSVDCAGLIVYSVAVNATPTFGAVGSGSPSLGSTNWTANLFTSTVSGSTGFVGAVDWSPGGPFNQSSSDLSGFAKFSNANETGCGGWKTFGAVGAQTANIAEDSSSDGMWYWVALEISDNSIVASGGITPLGVTVKTPTRGWSGSVASAGVFNKIKVVVKVVSGGITPLGVFAKVTQKKINANITPIGLKLLRVSRSMAGTIGPSGYMRRASPRTFTATITPAGVTMVTFLGRLFGRPGRATVTAVRAAEAFIRIRRT
jgi:hypothetical protein